MSEIVQEVTAEEIAKHYSACLDSCNLLNAGQPEDMSDEEWADTIKRNKDHLILMLEKDFWQDQDLQPLKDAVA